MTLVGNRFLAAGALCALLAGLFVGAWNVVPGLPSWDDLTAIRDAAERRQCQQRQLRLLHRRLEGKTRACDELLAGRITLLETAARFRDLCLVGPPFPWDHFHDIEPGQTEDERFCDLVIAWAEGRVGEESQEVQDAVLGRLHEELERHKREGTLHLRPPAPLEEDDEDADAP